MYNVVPVNEAVIFYNMGSQTWRHIGESQKKYTLVPEILLCEVKVY